MRNSTQSTKYTTLLIYFGTFLISVLSFFTTYFGLAIFLDQPLALLGSLGLQTAMLGVAWNLIRLRNNRAAYMLVFCCAATFSIFFSYVNFNANLKGAVRSQQARDAYSLAARPVLRQYADLAKEALTLGQYQSKRLADLLELENSNGWATVVDEGSSDPFIQSVIEGARRTAESWKYTQGTDYRQGSGKGIITNYLTSWTDQVDRHLSSIKRYVHSVDSVSLLIRGSLSVADQHDLVNYASVIYPLIEHEVLASSRPVLLLPPFPGDYVESPANRQQAMNLVISDLYPMDRLTFFSLFFAIIIDLIVIVMALSTSHAVDALDYVFARLEEDASRRLRKIPLDDPQAFTRSMEANLERLRQADEYTRNLDEVLRRHHSDRTSITLRRGEEKAEPQKNLQTKS